MRAKTAWDRWVGGGVALIVLVALVVVGCEHGPAQITPSFIATATAKANSTATANATAKAGPIPPALGTITPGEAVTRACRGDGGALLTLGTPQVGTYDSWQALPANLPLAPQPIAVARSLASIALHAITVSIPIVPAPSGANGSICAVTARITNYAPLAAAIPNVTRACSDHPYLDPGGADYGGDCGPGPGPAATARVAFASTAPGTTISEPISNAAAVGDPAVFSSAGTQSSEVWIVVSVPVSGTYSVVIGLWQGQAGPTLRLQFSDQFNLEAAHEWSGQACTLPAMQAKLPPPGNPPVALLCPGAPPLS